MAGQPHLAGRHGGAVGEGDVEALRGQVGAEAFRPFDQRDALGEGVLCAQFEGVAGVGEAKEVKMIDRAVRDLIDLDQGEGRARHFLAATTGVDEGGGQR